jgi:multidrug efflux pump subunit AcrA (membrane-fusion protein)
VLPPASAAVRPSPLFRVQALAYATVRQYGSIVLLRPAGLAWLTGVFCLIAVAILVFFATADYTRKEQASGVLMPALGLIRVQSLQPGLVLEVRVHEDQPVHAGDVLFVLAGAAVPPQDCRDEASARRQVDAIEQGRAGTGAPKAMLVRALQAGVVSGVTTQPGQTVTVGQVLANLSPAGSPLVAELYVSSRAAGFARPGMPVQIRYQAYPFQKFGQFQGTVNEVSRSPLADAPGAEGARRPGEALYRIRVALARQDVSLAGEARPLMAGMALDASLLLETRKLYEWVLEPLYGNGAKE